MKVSNMRKISYRSCNAAGEPVPCLPLQGKHLEQHGFHLGETVAVDYQRGKIVITLVEKSLIQSKRGDQYGIQQIIPQLSDQLLCQA